MWLPPEISQRLTRCTFAVPDLDDGEAAWSQSDALAVIKSLERTLVPVATIRVVKTAPWGFAPTNQAWTAERLRGELDSDFARRTRTTAADFIRSFGTDIDEVVIVRSGEEVPGSTIVVDNDIGVGGIVIVGAAESGILVVLRRDVVEGAMVDVT